MPNANIYRERGKVIKITAPNESVKISVVKRGNTWDAFVEHHGVDGDEVGYVSMDSLLDWRLDKELASKVLGTLVSSLASDSGHVHREDEEVYYAEAGGLKLYYFKKQNAVYVVDGETALNLGPPKDAFKYASGYLAGPKADVVRAFVHAVAKGKSVTGGHKKSRKKKTPA